MKQQAAISIVAFAVVCGGCEITATAPPPAPEDYGSDRGEVSAVEPYITYTGKNEALEIGSRVGGKLDGTWVRLFPDGRPAGHGQYVAGRRHGHWSSWYSNRLPLSNTQYVNGVPEGHWTFWHPVHNRRMAEMEFRRGKLQSFVFWENEAEVSVVMCEPGV